MKKAILIFLAALLLCGCQSQQTEAPVQTEAAQVSEAQVTVPETEAETQAPTEIPEAETQAPTDTFLPDPTEESVPLSYTAYQVVYNILTEEGQESAVFQGIGPEGNLAWTYETQSYPMAQLARITPVGVWEDRYYLVEEGTVIALDVCTGKVLFENPDFMGSPAPKAMLIDDYGYLYLSGYDSPDFFAMDPSGKTVKRIPSLSDDYCMPMEISLEGDQLVVYMESDGKGGSGRFPCPIPMDWLPQAQG